MTLEENVRKHFLKAALEDIREYGIYWTGSITGEQSRILEKLLLEHSYPIMTHQPGPNYENAYFLEHRYTLKDVEYIARQRAK